ncbi:Hypothetical protein HVR_LOCUS360 [uncultured virus]|nr:Hypothetical protein HVR_LOCUS360 [uncultured virus]
MALPGVTNLLGVTKIPTIIVNAYDLIWHDVNIDPLDKNPFFFKNDPVEYFRNLRKNGWTIYKYYSGSVVDEAKRVKIYHDQPQRYLTRKIAVMNVLFTGIVVPVTEDNLPLIIKRADSSSFAIIDPSRDFYPGIARYSPFEIFESADPPSINPDDIVFQVEGANIGRSTDLLTFLVQDPDFSEIYDLSNIRNTRYESLRRIREDPILIIWSPVYRYLRDKLEDNIDERAKIGNFDRPDYDDYNKEVGGDIVLHMWGF